MFYEWFFEHTEQSNNCFRAINVLLSTQLDTQDHSTQDLPKPQILQDITGSRSPKVWGSGSKENPVGGGRETYSFHIAVDAATVRSGDCQVVI